MKKQEKLQFLRNFKETALIENVIRPLFEKMGFQNITLTHGLQEHGLDLVCFEQDKFGEREYIGIQVKAAKIHGSAGKKENASEIFTQAQQAFTHSFIDINDNKEKRIDKYIVMTSGEITHDARDSICGQLKTQGYLKSIQLFDGNKLADLVDQWMPDFFWQEYNYFNRYFNDMKKDFETIKDISAIGQKETVNLEDIYVSLKLEETLRLRDLPMEVEREETAGKIFDEAMIEKRKGRESKTARVIEPETALKQFHRIVIVGAPGAGKTTLLKHLALKNCRENLQKQERITVPIPITLRDFSQSGKSLREYIDAVFEKYGFPEASKFVEKDLNDGKCILFLDGFDELAARENQEKVTKEILEFVSKYHGSRVVVTSRPAGYHHELAGFTRLEVMAFVDQQIQRFILNWFGKPGQKKAQSLFKVVMENENIKTLARNPLMVAIIAIIYEEDRELPNRRVDLYKRAVDVLLSRWDLRKKLKNRFKPDQKEFILKKLAFQCHCRNSRVMKEAEIFTEIGKYSTRLGLKEEDAQPFLEEIWQRSYLLRQISVDTYDFLHLSFQEYFTALELKEQEDGSGTIIVHIARPWWEEPILLYAGISKDAGPLITRIQNEVPEDIFYSNLMLSGKCTADAEFTDPTLKQDISQKLWSLYQTGEFVLLKGTALEVLRRMKPREIIHSLILQLNDDDTGVRWRAASALGAMGDDTVTPSLLKALEDEKETVYHKEYYKKVYRMKVKDFAFESLYKISRRVGVRIVPEDRRRMTDDGRL
jgi:hypothetical protein